MDINLWAIIWGVFVVVFVLAELIAPTFSFYVWFAIGAIFAGFTAYKEWLSPELQIVLFLVISIILILATKPLQRRLMTEKTDNMDTKNRIVGKRVQVVEEINNFKEAGKVFVEGSYWRAKSYKDDETYAAEEIVTVIDFDGIHLIVKK